MPTGRFPACMFVGLGQRPADSPTNLYQNLFKLILTFGFKIRQNTEVVVGRNDFCSLNMGGEDRLKIPLLRNREEDIPGKKVYRMGIDCPVLSVIKPNCRVFIRT